MQDKRPIHKTNCLFHPLTQIYLQLAVNMFCVRLLKSSYRPQSWIGIAARKDRNIYWIIRPRHLESELIVAWRESGQKFISSSDAMCNVNIKVSYSKTRMENSAEQSNVWSWVGFHSHRTSRRRRKVPNPTKRLRLPWRRKSCEAEQNEAATVNHAIKKGGACETMT